MKTTISIAISLGLLTMGSASLAGENFWDQWSDGLAEVSAYRLTQPRYGENRDGRAVLIFVAEPSNRKTHVKPDPGNHPDSDIFYVLKLNHLRTFQTGTYPYRIMTSTFTHVDPDGKRPRGSVSKVSFTSQEWCGTTFHQLLFGQDSIRSKSFSYFDGEADQECELAYPDAALVGDNLFTAVRGLFGDLVARGESREFAYLPSLTEVRLKHKPIAWSKATVSRSKRPEQLVVTAGTFQAERYIVESTGRPTLTVWVESAPPRRIIRWEATDGEKGELTGSKRMKYWQLISNKDQQLLEALGLSCTACSIQQ